MRPQILGAYAGTLNAASSELAAVREALAAVHIDRGWFGKLPQSGLLADRYTAHREAELAAAAELSAWLATAADGLGGTAERYSGADRVAAELAGTVETGLGIGTGLIYRTNPIPESEEDEPDE
ncbi:MAG: hypothetical protein HOV87_25165 [Catenulispora sp.]|nr:hypothetical protein [Catenulispora sp.]